MISAIIIIMIRTNYHLPTNMGKMREAQKLGLPPRYLRKGSRCFCVPVSEEINNISDVVLAEDILQQQELTAEGKFRCRFPGCNKSFKYSGKTRRNLLHFRPRLHCVPIFPICL